MIFAGIDIGSITAKSALISKDDAGTLSLMGTRVIPTGYNPVAAAEKVFTALLDESGIKRDTVTGIIATGYGRNSV